MNCLTVPEFFVIEKCSRKEKGGNDNEANLNSSETFWTTTGMFPQEFIISFHKCVKISKLTIQCYLGKNAMYFHVLIFTVVSHSATNSLKNNPQECS
uniref:Heat shock protein family B (small) member 11 n=1 Tax=Terrapene triunguis TaxID=2587831 RepID=A0A674ICQ6_9SAUR